MTRNNNPNVFLTRRMSQSDNNNDGHEPANISNNNKNETGTLSSNSNVKKKPSKLKELTKRVTQLERLVSKQTVEIQRLRQETHDLGQAAAAFAQVVELLRQAGLSTDNAAIDATGDKKEGGEIFVSSSEKEVEEGEETDEGEDKKEVVEFEDFDGSEIFGTAPTSVIDAADAAGAAILAAVLGGKLRMLVDVRDAELSRDNDILAQFIELAILPVAAGLEGLDSHRNRVKLIFPKVSQLLQYRKAMALSAPEVVALSTLGFDAVEDRDNLVVILAPSPDDEEGMGALLEVLNPVDNSRQLDKPVVVVNYHMVPLLSYPISNFEVVYHLRLLSVQYMTGDMNPEYVQNLVAAAEQQEKRGNDGEKGPASNGGNATDKEDQDGADEDAALEAAMEHAHNKTGVHQGITRAMVIRAYPRPWHVFVDTSPDPDSDFEVAATFDEEPSPDDVNYAIVECLEGSEREDELVAQQMQEALEAGQLSKVNKMLGIVPGAFDDGDDQDLYSRIHNVTDDEDDSLTEDSC
eukprot:CAMPEP_0172491634 /NCGR_PEP_ID=MMETSP1066-20121228/22520_1 /TAXON_ID=671091 /ORGANISM="Coscinodiscus wailesii, Strain CCMP2513" /LENGTH=520 /DNA_ID=CAMNT_0013260793 /DNA_START=825 /DNA_END=2386 /DNA_ORIENTATION=+